MNEAKPAFPMCGEVYGKPDDPRWAPGMTLREWYAGLAMQAMVSCYRQTLLGKRKNGSAMEADHDFSSCNRELLMDEDLKTGELHGVIEVCEDAFKIADKMIRQGEL